MAVKSAHLCKSNSYPLYSCRVTWIKTKRKGEKSGRSGALKPGKLGVSRRDNKCSDAGTGDLGVLPNHKTSPKAKNSDRTRVPAFQALLGVIANLVAFFFYPGIMRFCGLHHRDVLEWVQIILGHPTPNAFRGMNVLLFTWVTFIAFENPLWFWRLSVP